MSSLPPSRTSANAPATAAARVALRERRSVSRSRSPMRNALSPAPHHHAAAAAAPAHAAAPSLPGTSRFAPSSSVAAAAAGRGGGGGAVAAASASSPAVDDHGLKAVYPPPARVAAGADVSSLEQYREMWRQSLDDPAKFWGELAERDFYWHKKWDDVFTRHNFDMRKGPITSEWFIGAETNLCYNCVDRHVESGLGDRVAFLWEGNDVGQSSRVTYSELQEQVVRLSNWLRDVAGVRSGDDVTLYMPMVPELPAAMLACARLGAVHSVVFGGFSADALATRLADSKSKVVLTAAAVRRGAKPIPLKAVVDSAIEKCAAMPGGHGIERVLVLDKPEAAARGDVPFVTGRDEWWHDALASQSGDPSSSPVAWVDAEHPLFKLYTSGSTGKPKGVIHSTAGYMVGTATTFKYVFDYKPGKDVYWCTADCGWITGHSYVTYGPLLHAATQVLFEGIPTFPDAGRMWQIVEKHKVTQLYTAPTAIRALESLGDDFVTRYDRSSLRVLGSVGEPIGPQAWRWYHDVVGGKNSAAGGKSGDGGGDCPIVDTWWQTETGAHMITPLPGATPLKPGSATLPFFGVEPALLDDRGDEIVGPGQGVLVIKRSWPSALRSLAGDQERFEQTYFAPYKGYYFSGDGARRDEDGYYWLVGRVDDVINVSGHRIGTAEVEAALTEHPLCAEAAVVPVEHPIKGQGIYAFVTLMSGTPYPPEESVRKELVDQVRRSIGAIATPDAIHWAPGLPKTRSGKIMRRILRKIASREEEQLGDTSTLADPSVVQTLIDLRPPPAAAPAAKR